MMTLGSLFDGIGGFPLAAVHCGGVPVWASEIEPFPMRVTKLRFPDMIHVGDITKLDGAKLPPVDVICGGSPCQDLSVAGLRKGLAGERSGLFMDQVRIVKEMRAEDERRGVSDDFIRPRYLVWENVPGAFSSANGEDFRAVIEEIVRIKECTCHVPRPDTGRWESAGAAILGDQFSLAWRVLDAQYWGVAQRRRRIFTGLMPDIQVRMRWPLPCQPGMEQEETMSHWFQICRRVIVLPEISLIGKYKMEEMVWDASRIYPILLRAQTVMQCSAAREVMNFCKIG